MNTGEVTLDLAEPFTTDLPPYLTVTFTKPPPRPGFPVRIGAGESATVDMGWTFDMGYTGPGNIDFSFTVNAVATQA